MDVYIWEIQQKKLNFNLKIIMKMNEFIANFIDQLDEEPNFEVTPETEFHNIDGWSSIIALSVMAMIDEEYDVQIKADEMRNSQTIQELYDIVQSYLNK